MVDIVVLLIGQNAVTDASGALRCDIQHTALLNLSIAPAARCSDVHGKVRGEERLAAVARPIHDRHSLANQQRLDEVIDRINAADIICSLHVEHVSRVDDIFDGIRDSREGAQLVERELIVLQVVVCISFGAKVFSDRADTYRFCTNTDVVSDNFITVMTGSIVVRNDVDVLSGKEVREIFRPILGTTSIRRRRKPCSGYRVGILLAFADNNVLGITDISEPVRHLDDTFY